MTTLEQVREALSQVMDPELNRSIVELGMVHDVELTDSVVTFTLALTTMACPMQARMKDDARQHLLLLDGVTDVVVNVREMTAEEKERIFGQPQAEREGTAAAVNHVKRVIAVLSGKGGVGKSSVSALLALALRRRGARVGLLDADITGPSIPKMLLPEQVRPLGGPYGILPVETDEGIKVMSINLLLQDPNQAVIWRGPLVSGAIKQFWGDVVWGELDYLVVDLPPGTSDASLTVMQAMPVDGVVLVTTPQSLAGMVVRKASSMAQQMDVPLLGLIENMSMVVCPDCGREIEVFGQSHAAEVAAEMGTALLGRLPLNAEIATLADAGRLADYAATEFEPVVDRLLDVLEGC